MGRVRAVALLALTAVWAAGCGSTAGTSPVQPSSSSTGGSALAVPTVFKIAAQRINATNNELDLSWAGNGTSYQLIIGTTSGASDVLSTELTGTTFTWTSPRPAATYFARVAAKRDGATSGFSDELSLVIIDIRNVIDAMYFHAGPMSDATETTPNPVAGVWPDGTRLRVLVSADAGETARADAQTFADQYAALIGGAITATTEITSDPMQTPPGQLHPESTLPEFTIGVRVQSSFCSTGALACANYGPAPIGPNRSMVTLALAGGLNASATPHEMGHAYGMGHIQTPATGRPELRFMMNSNSGSEQMTDAEKLAITLARAGGLRAGMTRSQAAAALLINPL